MHEQSAKVKFGASNNEIYAEVASTRLMWALGFYADSWFPVFVTCNNCPADPQFWFRRETNPHLRRCSHCQEIRRTQNDGTRQR